ncbi:MAG: hypothetical protein NW218_18390 [Saprospiraceae bacterium]|nr:hypothetical protein [Saprospiraceae bacterium]
MKSFILLFLGLPVACCKTDTPMNRDFSNVPISTVFSSGQKTGVIQGNFVKELSGIAASHRNPDTYWVHSDGKKATEIYLIDSLGNRLATCQLPGVLPQDCEDIAVGAGPEKGISYIYLADIGDNNAVFDTHFIYRIPEPGLPAGLPRPAELNAVNIEKMTFQYPNGERLNAETLLLDHTTLDLLVLTKASGAGTLFRFPFPQSTTTTTTLERITELPIDKATAGDVSPDGTEVLLKNKKEIFYWKALNGENLCDLLVKRNPQRVPYLPEIQGEAICFNVGATGFLISTERASALEQPIFYFSKN